MDEPRLARAVPAPAKPLVTGSIPALTCADVCRCLSLLRSVFQHSTDLPRTWEAR